MTKAPMRCAPARCTSHGDMTAFRTSKKRQAAACHPEVLRGFGLFDGLCRSFGVPQDDCDTGIFRSS